MILFFIILAVVIFQRLTELIIAKRNEKYLLSIGGKEFGASHYKYIVLMHTLFFVSLITEYFLHGAKELHLLNGLFLVTFTSLQVTRIWVLKSLGKFWNTKIIVVPGAELIRKGPYKFLKHPNYVVVALELFTLPMIFDLYYTAIIFSVLNFLMLRVRINEENNALELCK